MDASTIMLVALPLYLLYALWTHDPLIARSALTTATVLCGLVLIPFVKPPTKAWVGGEVLSGDWRPTILAVGMLALYGVILSVPFLYRFFGLSPLPILDLAAITGVVAVWALGLRFAWRAHLFERFLGLDLRLPEVAG
ncbi:MAG TPA: hypothetical protein VKF37_06565 [Chloroflexota bacterium]|nr:hypothetical protein [Chloroflexota bacterium]